MGIGKFNRRNALLVLLSILFFLPLMFLNIRHDHDWGGDFAQYIAQADNIAHFRPMNATGYVYNKDYPSLAPKAYPPGFPLLIAPITRVLWELYSTLQLFYFDIAGFNSSLFSFAFKRTIWFYRSCCT